MNNLNPPTALPTGNLLNYLDTEELELLFKYNKIISFAANDVILKQGYKLDGIFVILEGSVSIIVKTLEDRTTDLEILGPGHFIGHVGYIENIPSSKCAIAIKHTRCLFISDLYFNLLSRYHSSVKYKLFCSISKQTCEHLKKIHEKIIQFMSTTDMNKRSQFNEIIYSLTKQTSVLSSEENQIDIESFLQTIFFQSFSHEELVDLVKNASLLKAPKHCTLINDEENKHSCFIVLRGAVQSSIIHSNKVAKLSVIGPTILFVSNTFIDSSLGFTIHFATCEQSILLKLSEKQLQFIQQNNSELWHKIFYLITRSLVALQKSVDKLDVRLSIENYNR